MLTDPIVAAVIVVALLLRRQGMARTSLESVSTWQAVDEVRPIPEVVARLPEVRAVRWGGGRRARRRGRSGCRPGSSPSDSLLASSVLIFGIVGLSLVVLTGWAGQVSLGQMGFVGVGAAIGGVATSEWGLDLSLALLVAGFAGAATAVLVGLPALRLQGLLLSVTTFAFALSMYSYFLNRQFFDWIPTGRIERPPLFGRIDWDSPTGVYYVILAVLVLAIFALGGHAVEPLRPGPGRPAGERGGRPGLRPAPPAPAHDRLRHLGLPGRRGRGPVRAPPAGRSGPTPTAPFLGFLAFTMVVIGGLGSTLGVLLGAAYLELTYRFASDLPGDAALWRLFSNSLGVLLVLMILPSGLGGLVYRLRDRGAAVGGPASGPVRAQLRGGPDGGHRGARDPHRPGRGHRPGLGPGPGRGGQLSRATAAVGSWARGAGTAIRHPRRALDELTGPGPVYALLILFGLNMVDELDRTAFGVLLPEIRDDFGLDLTGILTLIAVVAAGALVLQIPIAQYADRTSGCPSPSAAPWSGGSSR